jgi:hypothetical protein
MLERHIYGKFGYNNDDKHGEDGMFDVVRMV